MKTIEFNDGGKMNVPDDFNVEESFGMTIDKLKELSLNERLALFHGVDGEKEMKEMEKEINKHKQ